MNLLSALLFTLTIIMINTKPWTTDSLSELYLKSHVGQTVLNPDSLLDASGQKQVEIVISNILEFKIFFILIDKIDPELVINYLKSVEDKLVEGQPLQSHNIKEVVYKNFLEDFINKIELKIDEKFHTLFVLYVIGDKQYYFKKILDYDNIVVKKCEGIAKNIKDDIIHKKYTKAFVNLFEKMIETENQVIFRLIRNIFLCFFGGCFLIFLIAYGCERYQRYKKCKKDQKFVIIKKEINEPKKVEEFLDKTCVICLDQFAISGATPRQQIDGPDYSEFDYSCNAHAKPDLSKANLSLLQDPIFMPTGKTDKGPRRESIVRITKLGTFTSNTPVVLHCGHSFHAKCVKNWLKKNDACPICRAKFVVQKRNSVPQKSVAINQTNNAAIGNTNTNSKDALMFFDTLGTVLEGNEDNLSIDNKLEGGNISAEVADKVKM